jgi:hypothetical protein
MSQPPGTPERDDRGPFDPEQWRALGMSKEDGLLWSKHRIGPRDALRWQRAGVSKPIDAVRWKIAGVGPDTVREWIYAEINAREAVAWNELGFSVAEARKHKRANRTPVQAYGRKQRLFMAGGPGPPGPAGRGGRTPPQVAFASSGSGVPRQLSGAHRFLEAVGRRHPQVVHSYTERQWFDDEAIAWASHGIEATDADAWKELGLTPVEAGRLQEKGMSAMQAAKAWWQAGIPFEEVADWIGAGLTPKEAAEQRAKGVTAERAAVMRSLRKDR